MKIKTLRDIHSSLRSANFNRYYEDSKWLEKDIRTMREIDKESKSKSKGLVHDDRQSIAGHHLEPLAATECFIP